jgi:drug/metabolite transporter (DMT)-like permease
MSSTYFGYLFTIMSAAAFASTSLFLKLALGAGMSVWSYSLLNSAFTLVMAGWMLFREPRHQRSNTGGLRGWVGLFTLCGAGAAIAFNVALVYLSISLGTILLFTYPAFVALGAWLLLGQRPSGAHAVALLMTLAGAILTANLAGATAGGVALLGIALALLAAVSHATYIVAGERLSGALTAVAATALTRLGILVGTVLLSPRVFLEVPSVTWRGWMIALAASVVAGVAPFLFLNRGIALIGANRAAIASVAELPFALALGMLFQGDVITPIQWAGAALIVAAVIVSQRQTTLEEESPHGSGSGAT